MNISPFIWHCKKSSQELYSDLKLKPDFIQEQLCREQVRRKTVLLFKCSQNHFDFAALTCIAVLESQRRYAMNVQCNQVSVEHCQVIGRELNHLRDGGTCMPLITYNAHNLNGHWKKYLSGEITQKYTSGLHS